VIGLLVVRGMVGVLADRRAIKLVDGAELSIGKVAKLHSKCLNLVIYPPLPGIGEYFQDIFYFV
jgi:hypothetical protein